MKDLINLLWAMAGAIVGFGVGILVYLIIYKSFPNWLSQGGSLPLIVVGILAGGGMVGGGWLSLYITARRDKARREKARDERKKFGATRRK